jgi:ribosomal protein S18 acetylase RimI-like enzyme
MTTTELEPQIRAATSEDWETIAEFNLKLAEETEPHALDRATVEAGVQALLADERKGRYFVATIEGRIIGQLMHTWEWSDWRNGDVWWLQSVYVDAEFRRRGVFASLKRHLEELAEADPHVVGLRLYVERDNGHAQATYRRLGFESAGYLVMERMFGRL